MRRPAVAVLLTLGLASVPRTADADPPFGTDLFAEVLETMMEAQAGNSLVLGHAFGPDDGTTLHFVSNLDPVARTFSFMLAPGQSYRGLPIVLTTVGAHDPLGDPLGSLYRWTVTGQIGAESIEGVGSLLWEGDPRGRDDETIRIGGREYRVQSELDVEVLTGTRLRSTGKYTFTGPAGGPGGPGPFGPYDGTDQSEAGGIQHRVVVPRNPLVPTGLVIFMSGFVPPPGPGFPGGGPGAFDVRIQSIPEPSSLVLTSIGVLAVFGWRTLTSRGGRGQRR